MEAPLNLKADRVIRVAQPSVTDLEKAFVAQALDDGQLSQGERVVAFEQDFAQLHGTLHGVSCNSGTSALQLALEAVNVGKEKVVCPTMTMVAVPNAILSAGGIPEFVDSNPQDGNADFVQLIHARSKHKTLVAVHLYGVPASWPEGYRVVIEDCCEAHFGRFADGTSVGSKGDLACFSFFGNKCIATGEGGMVITNRRERADLMRLIRAHAFTPGEHFHHSRHALGCRMTELQGALGLAQLARKDEILRKREQVAKHYQEMLSGVWWLETMLRPSGSVWWVYPVLIRKGTKYTKDEVRRYLHEHGVETRSFFKPMHLQPHLKEFAHGKFPVAEDLFNRGFYMGIHCGLSESDISYTADLLRAL